MSTTMLRSLLYLALTPLLFTACQNDKQTAIDAIIHNAQIYTVNDSLPSAEALAIVDGLIYKVGTNLEIMALKTEKTTMIDAEGHFLMPGFIEGHGHFSGLGKSLQNLNFLTSKNWKEIVNMVQNKVADLPSGEWVEGRGWHQEKWDEVPENAWEDYPIHQGLSEISPDNPVVLFHASGHSLFANQKAMDIAGVSKETFDPIGGAIIKDAQGNPIGVFEERAMDLIKDAYQNYLDSLPQDKLEQKWYDAIDLAVAECLAKGITSFQDAGSLFEELPRYEKLALESKLGLRLWTMIRHSSEEMKGKLSEVKKVDIGPGFFTCNAIKSEVDGALGAFGAWLLEPYSDKPGFVGQNTTDIYEVKEIADLAIAQDMQLCVHAIGDRANRVVLDIYEGVLSQSENPSARRWRIEHAQHLDTADIGRFKELGIIASMQGVHCTSDAPFVEKRLGAERARLGAYAWRSLLDAGVKIANGTDAPVEDVDPIKSFYASVTRRRADSGLTFYTEQAMTRAEALKSYTLDNAFAAFEEDKKGSIQKGKYADLVLLSENLLTCDDNAILDTEVLMTIVAGEVKYER